MDRLTLDAAGASWPSWERQKMSPASSFICYPPLQVLVSRLTGQVRSSTHFTAQNPLQVDNPSAPSVFQNILVRFTFE